MKHLRITALLAFFVALSFVLPSWTASANTGKVGVLYSEQNEKFMFSTNVAGKYTPPLFTDEKNVDPKIAYSSAKNKSNKLYELYRSQGYNVAKLYDEDLNDLSRLNQFEVIVLPYTVMLNHKQRENIRHYIYGGGNAQFIFATARNEWDDFQPDPTKMDLSPLIYDTLTYIWEWDNLTEVFQSTFRDDMALTNMQIKNVPNSTHPILLNAYKRLGKNNITLKENGAEWVETLALWPSANVQPILTYADYTFDSYPTQAQRDYKSKYITKGETPALLSAQYGAGRIVYSSFKIYDYFTVDYADYEWHGTKSVNQKDTNTEGEEDAKAVLAASLDWLMERHNAFAQREYDLTLTTDRLSAYVTPQKKFAFRGTVTMKNTGKVPVRGEMVVQVLNQNNKSIGEYRKIITGLAPHNLDYNSFAEKFEMMMPGNIADGTYKLKITFNEARHDRLKSGFVTRGKMYTIVKKGNNSTIKPFAGFKDVGQGSHLKNINNAAEIGIITGYENGTFKPGASVSRINAMMMMLRAMGVQPSASAALPATVTDIKKGAYGYDVLATAYTRGLINIQDNKINANGVMKRGEMAQALVKGFGLQGTADMKFTDIGKPDTYAQYNNIATLYHHRITTGTTASLYAPYDNVTRAQFATFIMRALENTSK